VKSLGLRKVWKGVIGSGVCWSGASRVTCDMWQHSWGVDVAVWRWQAERSRSGSVSVCEEMEGGVIASKHHRLCYWERWFRVEVASDVSIAEVSVGYQIRWEKQIYEQCVVLNHSTDVH
jgi:hypothetical protein